MIDKLYLDDLTIGDIFVNNDSYEVTEEEIIAFAKQYDPQVFHTDPEKAKETFFNGLASSGWLTAAISMHLTAKAFPIAEGLIGANVDLKWPSATRVGDELTIVITIVDIIPSKSKPQQGIVTYETVTKNQHQEIRQICRANILVFRRPTE